MTNYEKNRAKVDKIWETNSGIAIVDGEVKPCVETACECCDLYYGNCAVQISKWLVAEHKEPQTNWSEVKVDTPIIVRDFEEVKWQRAYFAGYENGKVCAWRGGRTSWTAMAQDDILYWNCAKLVEGAEE